LGVELRELRAGALRDARYEDGSVRACYSVLSIDGDAEWIAD
jgi:hypothetical protein